MNQQEMQQMAGEIGQVLRTMNTPQAVAPVEPPVKPEKSDTTHLNEAAKRQAEAAYESALVEYAKRVDAYANYLLSKPESEWSPDEVKFMAAEIKRFLNTR